MARPCRALWKTHSRLSVLLGLSPSELPVLAQAATRSVLSLAPKFSDHLTGPSSDF